MIDMLPILAHGKAKVCCASSLGMISEFCYPCLFNHSLVSLSLEDGYIQTKILL